MPLIPSIEIGSASTGGAASSSVPGVHHADLGKLVVVNGNTYRLVRANAAISAAANKVVIRTAATANTVNTTTTANSPLVAGVIPAGQTGSDGSTGLLAGDYFYVQVGGIATPIVNTGSVAAGTGMTTFTDAGECDAVSATFAATTPGVVFATLLAASTANTATSAKLVNLI